MNKKLISAAGLVLVAVLAVYAVFFNKGSLLGGQAGIQDNRTPAEINPNAPGMPVAGTVEAVSATSITVKPQSGAPRTFAATGDTLIISTVEAGEVGLSLAAAKVGSAVTVVPSTSDASVAANIQLVMPPVLAPAPPAGSTFVNISGPVLSHSASGLVVKNLQINANAAIAITQETKVISNVAEGERGLGLSDIADNSTFVSVGAVDAGGTYTAHTVQILVPIAQ